MTRTIFLSASIPDPNQHPVFAATSDSVAIASAISALLYVTLGRRRVVWGGHPAITPMIMEMCHSFDVDYGKWVTLYQSRYFEDQYPDDNKTFQNTVYVDRAPDGRRDSSLTKMRRQMIEQAGAYAGVFVGGMDGVLEEAKLFRTICEDAVFLPVASTGGAALELASGLARPSSRLHQDLEYIGLFHDLLQIDRHENRSKEPAPVQPDR